MITQWTDIMVDLETTGTDVVSAQVIQIAAVFFNLKTGELGPTFDRCLTVPPVIEWNKNTLKWWMGNLDRRCIMSEINGRAEEPSEIIKQFISWIRVNGTGKSLHFWSKPSHFDFNLLDKYFRKFGYENPFVYWKARDMRSYLLGLVFPESLPDLRLESKDAHNALADVKFQVNELIRITKERKKL